jgi:cell division protein ZapA
MTAANDRPNTRAQKVRVDILNREFAVACSPDEKPALIEAAKLLDGRIRKLRSQGVSTSQFEQLLVVVALNLCHELKNGKGKVNSAEPPLANNLAVAGKDIQRLIDKIDQVLKA